MYLRTMTVVLASLVFLASSETGLEARCGGGNGFGLFGRLRANRISRIANRQARSTYWVPANQGATNALASCACVQVTGSCSCNNAAMTTAVPTYQAISQGCQIVNGKLVCPVQR